MNGTSKKINFKEVHDLALRLAGEPPFTPENLYVDLLLTLTVQEIQSKFDFILKGGTALLKTWTTPYRFSYDLDFSCYPAGKQARNHYKTFKDDLEKLVDELGFSIEEEKSTETGEHIGKHREGGRIFILHLMDKSKYLKQPIKLSVSCIDAKTCYPPERRLFKPIIDIPFEKLKPLYLEIIPKIQETYVTVLTLEELCAEKIRALATRGPKEEWSFLLRDAADLYVLEQNGVLDRVLANNMGCINQKFLAIKNRSYWKKLERFISGGQDIKVREENLAIFFDPKIIDEEKAKHIVQKIRERMKDICPDISSSKSSKQPIVTIPTRDPSSVQETTNPPNNSSLFGRVRKFLGKFGLKL